MCWYKAVANERTVITKEYMNAANTLICTPCPTKVPPIMVAVLLANVNYWCVCVCVCACMCMYVLIKHRQLDHALLSTAHEVAWDIRLQKCIILPPPSHKLTNCS